MHGCNSISCFSVTAKRISEELNVVATRISEELNVVATRISEELNVVATRISEDLSITAKGIDRLKVTCSIICSVNKDSYLRVSTDVVWLTPDMLSGEFDIYSNVVWKID